MRRQFGAARCRTQAAPSSGTASKWTRRTYPRLTTSARLTSPPRSDRQPTRDHHTPLHVIGGPMTARPVREDGRLACSTTAATARRSQRWRRSWNGSGPCSPSRTRSRRLAGLDVLPAQQQAAPNLVSHHASRAVIRDVPKVFVAAIAELTRAGQLLGHHPGTPENVETSGAGRGFGCTDSCTGLDDAGRYGSALDGLHGRTPQTTDHCTDRSTLAGRFRGGLNPSDREVVWFRIPPRAQKRPGQEGQAGVRHAGAHIRPRRFLHKMHRSTPPHETDESAGQPARRGAAPQQRACSVQASDVTVASGGADHGRLLSVEPDQHASAELVPRIGLPPRDAGAKTGALGPLPCGPRGRVRRSLERRRQKLSNSTGIAFAGI